VAAHALVAAGAEGLVAGARENDDADLVIVVGAAKGVLKLADRLGTEGVADAGAVDRDLGDALRRLVDDVLVGTGLLPGDGHDVTSS